MPRRNPKNAGHTDQREERGKGAHGLGAIGREVSYSPEMCSSPATCHLGDACPKATTNKRQPILCESSCPVQYWLAMFRSLFPNWLRKRGHCKMLTLDLPAIRTNSEERPGTRRTPWRSRAHWGTFAWLLKLCSGGPAAMRSMSDVGFCDFTEVRA